MDARIHEWQDLMGGALVDADGGNVESWSPAPLSDMVFSDSIRADSVLPSLESDRATLAGVLVAFDPRVASMPSIVANPPMGATLLELDTTRDGLEQIARAIEDQSTLATIHLVAHASDDRAMLGTTALTAAGIAGNVDALAPIGAALGGGSILLHGEAAGLQGAGLIEGLARITGASVSLWDKGNFGFGAAASGAHMVSAATLLGGVTEDVAAPVIPDPSPSGGEGFLPHVSPEGRGGFIDPVDPSSQVATTGMAPGSVAVVGYNTGQTDGNGSTVDTMQIVLMQAIGSGTQIFITDRAWNGSSFTTAAGDGTITYTAGADLAAGTVINLTMAGGFDLEQNGDAVYIYQGTINAPTNFLGAIEIADGNATFNGSLTNTGLTSGTNAVAVALDSASYSGPTTEAGARLFNGQSLLQSISDATNWAGDDADGAKALDQPDQSGPYGTAADLSIWATTAGGGGGIVSVRGDTTVSSGNAGFNLDQVYTNLLNGGVNVFWQLQDIAIDAVHGKFFVADSDITGGHNRILQGNLSDLIGNPTSVPALTVLYSDTGTTTAARITNVQVDPNNGIVYFDHGQTFAKVNYNTASQTPTTLANFSSGTNPIGNTNNFIDDFVLDLAHNTVYLSSHRIVAAQDGDQVSRNYVYKITGLTNASGSNAFTFASGISFLPFNPDDDDANNGITFASGEGFPQEKGTVEGLALSPDGNTLYIVAAKTLYDNDGDGGIGGGSGTAPILTPGGIYSYALTGNAAGNFGNLYVPTDDGDTNSQTIQPSFGPQGLLDDISIDPVTGKLYFIDWTGDQLGATNPPGDEGIWRVDTDGTPDPVYFANVNNINGNPPGSLFLNRAPTVTTHTEATPTVTEASSAPSSAATSLVQPFTALDVSDAETANLTDQLAGAIVRISGNFQSGSTHQDTLTINGNTSGTANGITYSYNASTGVMTLTGATTFNNYEATIALVRFNTSGDDITAYGAATNRTISWSVSDGLDSSDEVSTTVTVTGINDAPVNTVGSTLSLTEDTTSNAIAGISISDVDSNPATQNVTVTLAVAHGTLTLLTNVSGGIVGGDITGGANGSGTITITSTQNKINATLAAASGLVYTPTGNYNGADALTVTTNDGGFNGTDPGLTGTGASEQDVDVRTINLADVNDAPTVSGAGTEAAAAINEDSSPAGQTASALFSAEFADTIDVQVAGGNPTGSPGDTFGGIVITGNGSNPNGQWQYFNGATWVNVGVRAETSGLTINAATLLRFSPATDFNGTAPTLTAHLVETGAAVTTGTVINLVTTPPGGTTQISTGTVVLTQNVVSVNDGPTGTGLQGDSVGFTEGGTALKLDATLNATFGDVDSTDFNGGSLTVAIALNKAAGEDQLGFVTGGNVTVAGNVVSVGGTSIGTFSGGGAGGSDLVFTFNAGATPARIATLVHELTYFNSNTDNPSTSARTIAYTLVDGDGVANSGVDTLTQTSTVTVTGVDDLPVAVADTGSVNENATLNIAVLSNDTDVDGGPKAVAMVNGNAISPGNTLTLPSGATVKLEADGTLTYNPNGKFNYLVSAATGTATGAPDTNTIDSFSYTLNGNSVTTVNVTINGVDGSGDELRGTAGADTITGTAAADYFNLSQGGSDTASGGALSDAFYMGTQLNAGDNIDGGTGTDDQIGIQGNYNYTFGANNLVGIETLAILSGHDNTFGDTSNVNYTYNLTTVDANVAAGTTLTVNGNNLRAGENLTFNGAAELDGKFMFYAGKGVDSLTGGQQNDAFFFGEGQRFTAADHVDGQGGTDDQLGLRGDYSAQVVFGATTMVNIETLAFISASDTSFAPGGTTYSYNVKLHDGNVAAGATLTVSGNNLRTGENMTVNGSSELDGHLRIVAGAGNDTLTGGALSDQFYGRAGQDTMTGGGGNDTFYFMATTDSATGAMDQITDFTVGDLIDLSAIDAISGGADDAFTFLGTGAFTSHAGEARVTGAGANWTLQVDTDGNGVADMAVTITTTGGHTPTIADFVL